MNLGLIGCGHRGQFATRKVVTWYAQGVKKGADFRVVGWPQSGLKKSDLDMLVIVVDITDHYSCSFAAKVAEMVRDLSQRVLLFHLDPIMCADEDCVDCHDFDDCFEEWYHDLMQVGAEVRTYSYSQCRYIGGGTKQLTEALFQYVGKVRNYDSLKSTVFDRDDLDVLDQVAALGSL